jgi:hypothetical protein
VQPLLLLKSNKYYILWMCVCSLSYPACKARAPYCHLWPALLYHIFPHSLINGRIFEGKLLKIECFDYLYLTGPKKFLILRRNKPDTIKHVQRPSFRVPLFLSARNKTRKNSNIKFHENPSSRGSRVFPCERTDGRTRRS